MSGSGSDFGLIESLLYSSGFQRLDRHLRRLRSSAHALGFNLDEEQLMALLAQQARVLNGHDYKVRVLLERDGSSWVSAEKVSPPSGPLTVMLAETPVESNDELVRFKTTRRSLFEKYALPARELGLADVLFSNELGQVTEAGNSNVFVELDGELLTPPLSAGLLPGVYRELVLETRREAREQVLTAGDVYRADAVFLCNSVRGWRQVTVRPGRLRL